MQYWGIKLTSWLRSELKRKSLYLWFSMTICVNAVSVSSEALIENINYWFSTQFYQSLLESWQESLLFILSLDDDNAQPGFEGLTCCLCSCFWCFWYIYFGVSFWVAAGDYFTIFPLHVNVHLALSPPPAYTK